MFEALAEIWNSFFAWAKENGDVLGTIGFLFAMTTVVLTNGKLFLQRMRGQPLGAVSSDALTVGAGQPLAQAPGTAIVDAPPPTMPDFGGRPSVAVTPPKERGTFDDHFADGLADDMVADLQQLGILTPEISAVTRLIDGGAEPAEVARGMNVSHVLTTSIRRQDEKLRVTVQLVDRAGAVEWSDRFNAEGDDLMAIQEHFARRITDAVSSIVTPDDTLSDPITRRTFKTREEALAAVSSPKSRLVALLLSTPPLGIFGAHRFYVGRPFTGILYFLTAGLFVFGCLIDLIIIAMGMFADGKGRPVRFWRPDPLKQLADRR